MNINQMKTLTRCEAEVMEVILSTNEQCCMQEILELINNKYKKNWKTQTVSTFLGRLVKKQYLTMKREGRVFYYYPTITLAQFKQKILEDCVYSGFNGQWDDALEAMKNCAEKQKMSTEGVEL